MKSMRLVVLGGTGFVGHHLIPRLVADGHRIVLLTRNREKHRELAVLPNVRLHSVDVHDGRQLRPCFVGADAVLNLVGILNESGTNTFGCVHVALTRTVITACQQAGVGHLHHMSSLQAGHGQSQYLRSRGEAESLVRQSGLDWTIYQPSVIFGTGDGLVSRFASLLRLTPALPLARAQSKLAPVHVGDVAEAIARCVADPRNACGHVFQLYGPDVLSLGDIVRMIRDAAGLRRAVIGLPDSLGQLQARVAGMLPGKPFSLDNFRSLLTDSIGDEDGLAALGIVPRPFAATLPQLLHGNTRQQPMPLLRDPPPR